MPTNILETPTSTTTKYSNEYLDLDGYKLHLISEGRGKGLAVYFRENMFVLQNQYSDESLQICFYASEDFVVAAVYRSSNDENLVKILNQRINFATSCLVIGDMNICSKRRPNHIVFQTLESMGFKLLVTEATHINGGHIDQAWLRVSENDDRVKNLEIFSPFFNVTDHDALLFTYYDPSAPDGKCPFSFVYLFIFDLFRM